MFSRSALCMFLALVLLIGCSDIQFMTGVPVFEQIKQIGMKGEDEDGVGRSLYTQDDENVYAFVHVYIGGSALVIRERKQGSILVVGQYPQFKNEPSDSEFGEYMVAVIYRGQIVERGKLTKAEAEEKVMKFFILAIKGNKANRLDFNWEFKNQGTVS